jgi:hypothetical protein
VSLLNVKTTLLSETERVGLVKEDFRVFTPMYSSIEGETRNETSAELSSGVLASRVNPAPVNFIYHEHDGYTAAAHGN